MANEQHIEQLRNDIQKIRKESGVEELKENFELVKDLKKQFSDEADEIVKTCRSRIFREYGSEKTTIGSKWTIKNGSVYQYSSSNKASAYDLKHNLKDFTELSEELRDTIKEALEEVEVDLSDRIDTNARTLMDDDRDFDAAKITLDGYGGPALKLIDLKDNRSCSGDSIDLGAELRSKKVKEIVKVIEYQPELVEVSQEMQSRIQDALETRRDYKHEVRN